MAVGSILTQLANQLTALKVIGTASRPETQAWAKALDVSKLKRKSLSLHWEFMYTRSMFETPDMIEQHNLLNRVAELIDAGTLKTTVGEHFGVINAANLRRAHALLESGKAKGKIVLEGF